MCIRDSYYVPAILGTGRPSIADPLKETNYIVVAPTLVVDASGKPATWPLSATLGHAHAKVTEPGQPSFVIDFSLEWQPDSPTLNGQQGTFKVLKAEVHQVGSEAPRHRYEQSGAYWTRVSTAH